MAIELVLFWEGAGADTYARRFRTAAAINDFSPALKDIAVIGIAPAIRRNFDVGGRPKWTPLQEETIKKKMHLGFFSPRKILVASAAMMESATDPAEYRITTHSIIAKPGPSYWIHHQRGTPNMPQRVIMNLQVADQRKIGGIFDKFIADHLAKHGLRVKGQNTIVGGGGVGA